MNRRICQQQSLRRNSTVFPSLMAVFFVRGCKKSCFFEYLFVSVLNVLNTSLAAICGATYCCGFSNVRDVTMAARQDAGRLFQLNFENGKFSGESQSLLHNLAIPCSRHRTSHLAHYLRRKKNLQVLITVFFYGRKTTNCWGFRQMTV